MSQLLDSVDQRTRLAGHNRMELLLFHLGGRQRFGVNVFKVREVLECPPLRKLPSANPAIRGVAHIRGHTVPVLDLGLILGRPLPEEVKGLYVVITEFNRTVQGFLVRGVDRILNLNWSDVLPPPQQMSVSSYLTAVTKVDDELVGIIDVEKILGEVRGTNVEVSADVASAAAVVDKALPVLVVDDSSTARLMIARTLEKLGIRFHMAKDGREALEQLQQWAGEGRPLGERLALVISDIEMPRMDGYTLTSEIRKDERLRGLYVLLHSSLSGVFNDAMVKKVGADRFLAKFNPDELGQLVSERLQAVSGKVA